MEQRSRLNNFGVLTKRELSSSLIGPQCHDIIHDTFLLRQCSNVRKFTVLNHTSDDKRFFEKCSVNYSQLSVSHLESLVLVWFAFHPRSVAARVCHSQAWWRSESDVGLVRKKRSKNKKTRINVCKDKKMTHLGLSAVCCGLVEFLVQLELDLCGLESALRLHWDNPSIIHADHQVGFGHVAHLPSGEAHTFNTMRDDANAAAIDESDLLHWNLACWWSHHPENKTL